MSRKTRSSPRLKLMDEAKSHDRRRRHNKISYKEPDSDDDYEHQYHDHEQSQRQVSHQPMNTPRRYPIRQIPRAPKQAAIVRKSTPRRNRRSRASTESLSQSSDAYPEFSMASSTTTNLSSNMGTYDLAVQQSPIQPVKPWTFLEYGILVDVFTFAARSLEKDKKLSGGWLVGAATTCKAFYEPALSALYQSPPLDTVESVRGFLAAAKDETNSSSRYRHKVKHLIIEAIPTLTKKDKSQDPVSLESILTVTPNLRSLAVELYGDDPSFKRNVVNFTSKGRANIYKPAMISAMEENKTFLRSMKWNYFFNLDQEWPWCELPKIHQSRSLQTLEDLEIVWLNSFTKSVNKAKQVESLISSLRVLPSLKSLTIKLSDLSYEGETLLNALPNNLESLSIIDCDDLTSDILAKFLVTHGYHLRCLVLNHNRSLSLGFLAVLATACPHLQVFKVDLSCYGLMLTSTDSEPSFQYLLPDHVTPTWPSTLQVVEMAYLRKWGRNTATTFFQSLVDSAEALSDLRDLVIKTTVDLDWRDRVAFRDEWSARLHRVFKSRLPPPRSYKTITKRINGRITGSVQKSTNTNQERKVDEEGEGSIAGRLRRRSRQEDTDDDLMDIQSASESRPTKTRKLNNLTTSPVSGEAGLHIQGQCNVVDIRIENLRPMETQYAERDFMDEELSGDEDWDGNDHYDSYVGGTYAW